MIDQWKINRDESILNERWTENFVKGAVHRILSHNVTSITENLRNITPKMYVFFFSFDILLSKLKFLPITQIDRIHSIL